MTSSAENRIGFRFLFIFAAILVTLALALCAAVTFTDPSRYFFGSPVPQIWPNTRRVKIDLFREYSAHDKVTGLILGSSRSGLLPSQEANRLTGLRFFNASVFDASVEDYLAAYRLFREMQSAPPKMLVLGLDTSLLSSHSELPQGLTATYPLIAHLDGKVPVAWFYAKLYARYFRIQTFTDLGVSLRNWRSPKPPVNLFFPDGHSEPGRRFDYKYQARWGGLRDFLPEYREFDSISAGHVEQLRTLLREAAADRVRIVLWITPLHPDLSAALERLPSAPVERRARELASRVGMEFGARVFDLSDPASFGGDPGTWVDVVHVSPVDAKRELDTVLQPVQN